MKKIAVLALVCMLLGSVVAVGGEKPAPGKIAKYIWVQTEQYQAGKEGAYMKLGQFFKEAMANTEFTWLAGRPITGNGNEVTYVTFHENFASVDKMIAAFEKIGPEMYQKNAALVAQGMEAVGHSRSYIAEFQPELSVAPDTIPVPQVTRWDVTTFQVKIGMRNTFVEMFLKELRDLHMKSGDNVHSWVYSVVAGEPNPAFLVVTPLKTLADLDEPTPGYDALMTPAMRKHIANVAKDTVAAWSSAIYVVDPRLSLPPKNFLAENPGFWSVKEPAPAVAKEKKAKKAVEPAAIKEKEKK